MLTDAEIKQILANKYRRPLKRGRPRAYTDRQAYLIRRCYDVLIRETNQDEIADLFGVSRTTLSRVIKNPLD